MLRCQLYPSSSAGIALQPRLRRPVCASAGVAAFTPTAGLLSARRGLFKWGWRQFKTPGAGAAAAGQASSTLGKLGRGLQHAPQRAPSDGTGRPGAGGARKAGLIWFRGDLRLHDHEALSRAQAECTSLLPVYCFDPRDYRKSPQGYDKTGPYRARFLVEAVADLRERLRAAGSELVVRFGRPEEVLGQLVRTTGAAAVYCHGEVTYEGKQVEGLVKAAVEGEGAQLKALWSNTLHSPDDLPFRLQDLPQNFDLFRERTAGVAPRAALETPQQLRGLPAGPRVEAGDIPTLKQLGLTPPPAVSSDSKPTGGETEALRQLRSFLARAQDGGSRAALARGGNFSNNIAPWLATGCLSPRHMLAEARAALGGGESGAAGSSGSGAPAAAQAQGGRSGGSSADPMSWIGFELLWRDFFRFISLKYSSMPSGKLGAGALVAA